MKKSIIGLTALFALTNSSMADQYLSVGDPAPSLGHVTWLKGDKTREFEKGKLYVVEFWATWCGPCKENIPSLTLLAKKYAGKVSISGIDIWESTDKHDATYMNRVSAFVKKEGDKMDYNVGADDIGSDTANAWMKAAGEAGIPMSFVVGKDGKIVWIGHAQGLEDVLAQITAGTYDIQAAKERRATEVEAVRPVKEAMNSKQFAKALSLMESILAKRPTMARYYDYDRYTAYAHIDLAKTKEMSNRLIKDSGGDIGAYQMMSSVYATQTDLSEAAYTYGMSLIQEALAKKDRGYLFLSMASEVSHSLHTQDKAIEYARLAVEAAQQDSHAPAPFVEFLRRNLQTLRLEKAH